MSVTEVVSRFFPNFNASEVADTILRSKNYLHGPYANLSKEQILSTWSKKGKIASEMGSKLHEDIHFFLNGLDVTNESREFQHFLTFLEDHPDWTLIRSEMPVCSTEVGIGGCVDAVFLDGEGKVILADWKRSSKAFGAPAYYNKTGLASLSHLPDNPLSRYSIQLNLYKYLIENSYGCAVDQMWIVQFNPNALSYTKHRVNNLQYDIEGVLSLI